MTTHITLPSQRSNSSACRSTPAIDKLRVQLKAAQAEVNRLTEELGLAEWLRDYDQAEVRR